MNAKRKLIIRIVAGAVLAFVIARVFRPESGPVFAVGLFIILVGLAYALEYFVHRNKQS